MNKIDFDNGRIDIGNPFNLTIDKNLTRSHFLNNVKRSDYKDFMINPPYYTYKINAKIVLNKWTLQFTLGFNAEKLESISLWVDDDTKKSKSWDDWSLEREMKIKRIHDSILDKENKSKQLNQLWGIIESNYDPRSGSSNITIRYK